MRSPTIALLWQIWSCNRQAAWMLAGITVAGWLADGAGSWGRTEQRTGGPGPLYELMAMASFLLVLAIFSYTEASGDKGIGRFPRRLFTLPVSSLRLVSVPVVSGVVAIELLYLAWMARLTSGGSTSPLFVAVLLAAFVVFYQTALWTLERLGALRLIVLGAIGIALFAIGILSSPAAGSGSSPWRSERFLGGAVAAAGVASFLFAWSHVARLRSGGGRGAQRLDSLIARAVDLLPSRRSAFTSPSSAHFWYEWRSAGTALPVLVGGILLFLVAPFSWLTRDVAGSGMGLLLGALLMPIVLAAPVGMAFAKPQFWSEELSIPPFLAVRPLSAADFVAIKLKVAAAAAMLSWLLVFAFLVGWLLLWGNAEWLTRLAMPLWVFHDHSVVALYGIAALVMIAVMFLTWRFLVVGLWAGLSGNRRLYSWSVMAMLLFVIGCMIFGVDRLPGWMLEDPARMAPFVWVAALAVIAKYWLAARTWRRVAPRLVRQYLTVWIIGTASFVSLGLVFWRIVRAYVAVDTHRLPSLLILLALLVVPLARVGLAPSLLERNRHRR